MKNLPRLPLERRRYLKCERYQNRSAESNREQHDGRIHESALISFLTSLRTLGRMGRRSQNGCCGCPSRRDHRSTSQLAAEPFVTDPARVKVLTAEHSPLAATDTRAQEREEAGGRAWICGLCSPR